MKQENKTLAVDKVRRIGTLYGFTPSVLWRDRIARSEVELVSDPSLKVLTRMLMNDMVTGLDLDLSSVRYQLGKLSIPTDLVTVSEVVPHPSLGFHMSTLNHPEVISAFNAFLKKQESAVSKMARDKGIRFGSQCDSPLQDTASQDPF